ncbi:hypothetical protein HanIR_Chr13g0637911 [Helianthus annuus]|nr:hypothetical protein HanIR_Chr13g0637911 [Helianthus annuus]
MVTALSPMIDESGLWIWQNHLVLKNDCWLFRGFRKTISSQGNESSSYQAHLTQRTTYTTKKVVASHLRRPGS